MVKESKDPKIKDKGKGGGEEVTADWVIDG
jgi:hypothetical protein